MTDDSRKMTADSCRLSAKSGSGGFIGGGVTVGGCVTGCNQQNLHLVQTLQLRTLHISLLGWQGWWSSRPGVHAEHSRHEVRGLRVDGRCKSLRCQSVVAIEYDTTTFFVWNSCFLFDDLFRPYGQRIFRFLALNSQILTKFQSI